MATSPQYSVSVAILTWNRKEQVQKAIQSALDQSIPPSEIIVVDSASQDGTAEAISVRFPTVKIFRLHRNMGCPEGRNIALANCHGDIIFSLDDDGWLAPTTLESCVNVLAASPSVGVVSCRIVPPEQDAVNKPTAPHGTILTTFSGGACAIKRKVLSEAGYFPSDFFRQAEEGDLSLRIMDVGYEIRYAPSAIVFHKQPLERTVSKAVLYYGPRNEIYSITRLYPMLLVLPMVIQKLIVWNFAGLKLGALNHTLFGSLAALLKIPLLLQHRTSISWATIQKVMRLKRNARQRRII